MERRRSTIAFSLKLHWLAEVPRLMVQRTLRHTKIHRVVELVLRILRRHAAVVATGFLMCLATIWLTGMLDFAFEEDFRHFRWPPFVNVRAEVVNELLNGLPTGTPVQYDWEEFAPVVRPSCSQNRFTHRKFLLIIVKSAPDRFEYRQSVRVTYGNVIEQSGFRLRTVFAMGLPADASAVDVLMEEVRQYDDMLIGNFSDSYRNNTYKFLNAIDLANAYCGERRLVPYLFLVDDDYLVSPANLIAEVRRHAPNERLYMGWRFLSSPFRFTFRKHRISLKDYPFAAYPPYITGGAVLLTGQTVREFYLAVKYVKLFALDDIYTSILAYLLGINAIHNENFPVYHSSLPGHADTAEWQNWRTLIAMHDFRPAAIIEKYQQLVETKSLPSA